MGKVTTRDIIIPDTITGTTADNPRLVSEAQLPVDRSMPVWHMHEELDYLIESGFSYIAIGSSGEFAKPGTPEWHARIAEAFAYMDAPRFADAGYPRPHVHMMRAQAQAARHDFESSDSTSLAVNGHRYKKDGGEYLAAYRGRIEAPIAASCDAPDISRLLDAVNAICDPRESTVLRVVGKIPAKSRQTRFRQKAVL